MPTLPPVSVGCQHQRTALGTGDDGERRRHVADDTVGERDDVDAARWVIAARVGFRVFQYKRRRDVLHFRTCRRQAYPGLEPADGIESRVVPAFCIPR
jgi:hypothetical protein